MELNNENLKLFWSFVAERHKIFERRFVKRLPAPWTEDPILQMYHFTNVYRELDRGTLYLVQMMDSVAQTSENVRETQVFNLLLYRLFNNLEFYEWLGLQDPKDFDLALFKQTVEMRWKQGFTVFNAGHLPPAVSYDTATQTKLAAIIDQSVGYIYENLAEICEKIDNVTTMDRLYDFFKQIPGIGEFYAYEFVCDVVMFGWVNGCTLDSWTHAGPGCRRGIDHIVPNRGGKSYEEVIAFLRSNQVQYMENFHIEMPWYRGLSLNLRNVEHSLCEFSKYMKVRGGRRTRRRFRPTEKPLPLEALVVT